MLLCSSHRDVIINVDVGLENLLLSISTQFNLRVKSAVWSLIIIKDGWNRIGSWSLGKFVFVVDGAIVDCFGQLPHSDSARLILVWHDCRGGEPVLGFCEKN